MRISNNSIELIKGFEGFSSTIYRDAIGKLTIGYGHLVLAGEEAKFKAANLTKEVATNILLQDIARAEITLNNLIKEYGVNFNQNQFDALCSLLFNIGSFGTGMISYFKNHDLTGIGNKILEYNHAGGKVLSSLTSRRTKEHELYCYKASV